MYSSMGKLFQEQFVNHIHRASLINANINKLHCNSCICSNSYPFCVEKLSDFNCYEQNYKKMYKFPILQIFSGYVVTEIGCCDCLPTYIIIEQVQTTSSLDPSPWLLDTYFIGWLDQHYTKDFITKILS